MKRLIKVVAIVGICAVGVVCAAHVVLGKERTKDAARALQKMAQGEVDELIRRQSDMKQELDRLRDDYPRQIALLKSQLNQIERRLDEIEKETSNTNEIVRMCEEDISYLQHARDTAVAAKPDSRAVEHRGGRYTLDEAQHLINRIGQTREMYANKNAAAETERAQLNDERGRVNAELQAVETEQAEFDVQYQGLLREIESLKRNEEVLKLAEQRRGKGCERHAETMGTLEQVKQALERAKLEQNERMRAANVRAGNLDYETRAKRLQVQRKAGARQDPPAPEKTAEFSAK